MAENVGSSGCLEKYFGDETKLVAQHLSYLFPFTPMSGPIASWASDSTSKSPLDISNWMSHKHLKVNIFPKWTHYLPHQTELLPVSRTSRYGNTIHSLTVRTPFSARLQVTTDCFCTCLLKFSHLSFSLLPPPAQDQALISLLPSNSGLALFDPSFILQPHWTQNYTALNSLSPSWQNPNL